MVLPLGKLTILVGAGIIGSVLAKEGRASTAYDFCSGALKIALKQLQKDDSPTPKAKPKADKLLQQVHSLREELQLLASNRPITIVTSTGSGSRRYSVIIVIVVVGYGYIWWKGWKLSDMMFASKRGLSDACAGVAKQLESVYSSISATKRHLSARIDGVDGKLDESADNFAATKDEVSNLREDVRTTGVSTQSIHHAFEQLENRMSTYERKQEVTLFGVGHLLPFAEKLENGIPIYQIQGGPSSSSGSALESRQYAPSRVGSLPSNISVELPSPNVLNGSDQHWNQGAISETSLKPYEASNGTEVSRETSPHASNNSHVSEAMSNGSSGSGFFGSLGSGASLVRRSFSAKLSFKI